MDFSLTDDQSMLADSIARVLQDEYDFETRQKHAATSTGFSAEKWAEFAELGWTAVLFDEADGGFGGGAEETMILMENVGRHLVVEPFVSALLLAGRLVARLGTDAQKAEYLEPVITGERRGTLAWVEAQARYDLSHVTATASKDGSSWIVRGHKAVVPHADSADYLIVPARTSGEISDQDGVSLFIVPADAEGVVLHAYPTVDGQRAAEVTLDGVRTTELLGDEGAGYESLVQAIDDATLGVFAEAVGIMDVLQKKTVDYSRERKQFGVPIGSFQALQHRMVDMLMIVEQARSLLYYAVMQQGRGEAAKAVSALKYYIGSKGRFFGEEAVQLHGGMGVTDEFDVAHYFKRLTMIDVQFGNSGYHLRRFQKASKGESA